MHDRRVYELDTDSLVSALLQALINRGEDVVEQVPAGVWWLRTDSSPAEVCQSLGETFSALVPRHLREIDQQH